jgi:hypothetical protein
MKMGRRKSQAVYGKRREMVSKFWAKIRPKYRGRLVGLFILLLVVWSVWSAWEKNGKNINEKREITDIWKNEKFNFESDSIAMHRLIKRGIDGFTLRFFYNKRYPVYKYATVQSLFIKEFANLNDYSVFPIERKGFYLVTEKENSMSLGYVKKNKISFDSTANFIRFNENLIKRE